MNRPGWGLWRVLLGRDEAAARPDRPPSAPMVALELDALPTPARRVLGVTARQPDPDLPTGWSWRAWSSTGATWRQARGDRDAGWDRAQVVTLRLAGPVRSGARDRVVCAWTRPGGGTWRPEFWAWAVGLPGSIPRTVPLGIVLETLGRLEVSQP